MSFQWEETEMNKLFRNTAFNLGFWIGLCLFAFLNYLVYVITYNEFVRSIRMFSAGGYWAGFPFGFYQVIIGNPNNTYFSFVGLILNVVVALISSFIIGLIFKFIWLKLNSHRLR
jgi:hypothetical protein